MRVLDFAIVVLAVGALLLELLSPCAPATAGADPAAAPVVKGAYVDADGWCRQKEPPRVMPLCPCGCKHKTVSLAGLGLGHDALLEEELEIPLRFTWERVEATSSDPPDVPERVVDPVPRPA